MKKILITLCILCFSMNIIVGCGVRTAAPAPEDSSTAASSQSIYVERDPGEKFESEFCNYIKTEDGNYVFEGQKTGIIYMISIEESHISNTDFKTDVDYRISYQAKFKTVIDEKTYYITKAEVSSQATLTAPVAG